MDLKYAFSFFVYHFNSKHIPALTSSALKTNSSHYYLHGAVYNNDRGEDQEQVNSALKRISGY